MKLHDFQNSAIDQIVDSFKTHKNVCLSYYTGSGKTNIFLELCHRLIKTNPNIKIGVSAFLSLEIRDQVVERAKDFGLKHLIEKITSYKEIDQNKNIYVFLPQSVYRRDDLPQLDYLIIDECHAGTSHDCVMINTIFKKNCNSQTKVLLVSATPWDTLVNKRFANAPVLKRSLDEGLRDGLITDFKFYAEEAQIEFKKEDFTRVGDLSAHAASREMSVLKSACLGKMRHLIKKYGDSLGSKILVICPPGNGGEIARFLAKELNGKYFIQVFNAKQIDALLTKALSYKDNVEILNNFLKEENGRLLFVVNKCSTGFDMKNLDTVIDLTMTRNIKILAQRAGRIARKNGNKEKRYFYVYDKSLLKGQLEWIICTMIDFALGAYDGWNTRSVKHRKVQIGTHQPLSTDGIKVSQIVKLLTDKESIHNIRTLSYVSYARPTKWDLKKAIETAKTYSSRTEMWSKLPTLYKWFRLNAKDEMDKIFPLKYKLHNIDENIKALEWYKGMHREEFKNANRRLYEWIISNKRNDLLDKYLKPPKYRQYWDVKSTIKVLKTLRTWSHVRGYPGMRHWMRNNGSQAKWRRSWEQYRITKSNEIIVPKK